MSNSLNFQIEVEFNQDLSPKQGLAVIQEIVKEMLPARIISELDVTKLRLSIDGREVLVTNITQGEG